MESHPEQKLELGGTMIDQVRDFDEFERSSSESVTCLATADGMSISVPTFVNEFWTSAQRAGHSLHEVSYRACFKPQLPRFFIERLTAPGDAVYDPFMGRGTTPMEAALTGRTPMGNDVNPLSRILVEPRLAPPEIEEVADRLDAIPWDRHADQSEDLLVFYHPETLDLLCSLREYLLEREADGSFDNIDGWIRMVAVNRLTGHSRGFFSVYTMPPNQAVSAKSQRKINARRKQTPEPKDVPKLILKKSRSLLRKYTPADAELLDSVRDAARLLTRPAGDTPSIPDETVTLVVTSPPFLNVVDYATDNWLRCWFCGIAPADVDITMARKVESWQAVMTEVFGELARILKPGGHIAFEVGEVLKGRVRLEDAAVPCGVAAGLEPLLVMINDQNFTKTAHCWGVSNRSKGTNTNRIVLFRKG